MTVLDSLGLYGWLSGRARDGAPAPRGSPTGPPSRPGRLLRHWPVLASLALAGVIQLVGIGGPTAAGVLAAAALVYAGASAWGRPRSAWAVFAACSAVLVLARFVRGLPDPTWLFVGLGLALWIGGLLRRGALGRDHLVQGVALLVFGAVAALAVVSAPPLGGWLVAAALLTHSAWDLHHYRRRAVVAASMAEFCLVLDAALALTLVAALLAG